jgi:cation diffusion facilitator CzcD-associated flavoprotein CzcO
MFQSRRLGESLIRRPGASIAGITSGSVSHAARLRKATKTPLRGHRLVCVTDQIGVVVIGAGQAGLAVSHELTQAGIPHVVLERGKVGQTWRGRWDSFCLVTPNWTVQLPGRAYDRGDPDGFMLRDEVVSYLVDYAAASRAPVKDGIEVTSLQPEGNGGYVLETSSGQLRARTVVLSTGAYQRPHRPSAASALPTDLLQIDAEEYRSPAEIPPGPVLVVGSGQSGCQIAEELHQHGRDVFLACGRAPWAPRRVGDHDIVWWAAETGFLDASVETLPSPAARLAANMQATGHDGGRDLHYRTLQRMGVTLLGHFLTAEGHRARFAPDLGESVAWGDERNAQLMDLVRKLAAERGLPAPEIPEAKPVDDAAPAELSLNGLGAVIFTTGFRPDYESWVRCPGAFDDAGFPIQEQGACIAAPGLYFVGVHFLRKRKSSLLFGVGEDAAIVAREIAAG